MNTEKIYKGTLVAVDVRDHGVIPNESIIVHFDIPELKGIKTYFVWHAQVEDKRASYGRQTVFNLLSLEQKNEVNSFARANGLSVHDTLRLFAMSEKLTQWLNGNEIEVRERNSEAYGRQFTPFAKQEKLDESKLMELVKTTSRSSQSAAEKVANF